MPTIFLNVIVDSNEAKKDNSEMLWKADPFIDRSNCENGSFWSKVIPVSFPKGLACLSGKYMASMHPLTISTPE